MTRDRLPPWLKNINITHPDTHHIRHEFVAAKPPIAVPYSRLSVADGYASDVTAGSVRVQRNLIGAAIGILVPAVVVTRGQRA